jgi:hypothetical protein
MLDNTIVLPVDPANDGNIVNENYTRYDYGANRATYVGDDHSLSSRNMFAVTRSFPTASGNFKGVGKSSIKFTQDIVVDGVDVTVQNTSPIIGAVNFSIPVGCTSAQAMLVRQRLVAAIDHAFAIQLTERLEV